MSDVVVTTGWRRTKTVPSTKTDEEMEAQLLARIKTRAEYIRELEAEVRERELALDKAEGQLEWKEKELDRVTRQLQRDLDRVNRQLHVSQKGYAAQKINFAHAITAALAAKDHAICTIDSTHRQARAANKAALERATVAYAEAQQAVNGGFAHAKAAFEEAEAANKSAYELLISSVRGAYDPFVEAAHAAMENINEEMREAGVDPLAGNPPTDRAPIPDIIREEDIVNLGQTFGANSRKPEKDEQLK
jgi:chromosome segregation ATPase